MDPDVATIRLVDTSDELSVDSPALLPVPTQAPKNLPSQPADLLSKLTQQSARRATGPNQTAAARQGSQPVCDPRNAPKNPPAAEPFATLTEADSRGVPKNWDVSTRRPKVVDEIGADGLSLVAPREFAPTPKLFDTSEGQANITLTSATENVVEKGKTGDIPFWVQPSLLGKLENTPFETPAPATAEDSKSEVLAEVEVAQPKTATESLIPESASDQSIAKNWASMPAPGRPEDNPAPKVESKPEPQPRRWAGLFVQEINESGSSKTYTTQVAFDQPITDSTVPGDNLYAQATPRRPSRGTGRRRMRLNFLDDPDEKAGDPTRDAIKSLLKGDDDESGDDSSLLDDLEDETSDYEERYRYAFEDVIEPLPIKKVPRNYAATLKDIFAEEESNPAIEQAFCGLMWSCAGGKCMTPADRMKRNFRRSYALFYSPCGTDVCRPMEGFEERARAMTPPPQTLPATTPQLSPAPTATPVPGLPQTEGPIQSLPNASASIPTAAFQ